MQKYKPYYLAKLARGTMINVTGIENEIVSHFKYHWTDDFNKKCPVTIEAFGITFPDKHYRLTASRKETTVIEYIISGKLIIESGGKKIVARKGDAIVMLPRPDEHYYADPKDPPKKIWVNIHGKMVKELFDAYHLEDNIVFPNCDILREMEETVNLENISLFSESIFPQFIGILGRIFGKIYCSLNRKRERIPAGVQEIKNIIDYSLSDKITLDFICQKTGLSKNVVVNKFKRYYGTTPKQYILENRISKAETMLINSNLTIKDIADNLGFTDCFAFSHAFKAKKGISPKDFRSNLTLRQ